ncbi:MAG: hypothetical protein QOH71_4339 [Blastocatellia bacterium]|jgi:hypothetical protein|nr:hypothetical protein [Blastocatellia bacterium]
MTQYQVNVAAEAFAAVVMSHAGYDVAMQYGTTQPDWDILATKGTRILKISVKGSQDGGWGLFQGYLENANYHGALDAWFSCQPDDLVYLFVQFMNVALDQAPRCYIARPTEILEHMRTTRGGYGYTSLREKHSWASGIAKGHSDIIPDAWRISPSRVDSI